jgi:hypothetical protein
MAYVSSAWNSSKRIRSACLPSSTQGHVLRLHLGLSGRQPLLVQMAVGFLYLGCHLESRHWQ